MAHQVEIVAWDTLRTHPKNPNRGDIESIRDSIRTHGFFGALVVQRSTRYILAGNHRYLVGCEEGIDQFPVYWVDVDDEAAARILLVDNRTSDLHTTDLDALRHLLRDMDIADIGSAGSGYDLDEIRSIMDDAVRVPDVTPQSLGPAAVRVDSLHTHPDNPRQGNVQAIAQSIQEHGFWGAITAQKSTRRVLIGNHRLEALRMLGIARVPVVWIDCDDERAMQIMLADNRVSDRAVYDQRSLTAPEMTSLTQQKDARTNELAWRYTIEVDCVDDVHQRELSERFTKDGLEHKCRMI